MPEHVTQILEAVFLGNTIVSYLTAFLVLVVGIIVVKLFKIIVLARLKSWAARTPMRLDDFLVSNLEKNIQPLLYYGVFYVALRGLTLNNSLGKVFDVLGVLVFTVLGIRFVVSFFDFFVKSYWAKKSPDPARETSLKAVMPIAKFTIWTLGLIFMLDNLGFQISAVIAGLGIGGIAVALAAQAVLGDLFSYVSILFDRPFEIGDFIIVGDMMGAVENIGIKTTRIRSLSGEELVFSNTDLTSSRVRNYKRMQRRRVLFTLGVTYDTNLAHLQEVPTIITGIIQSIDDTVFDRCHFSTYGDFSLNFETVYYVQSSDYNKYMDIQQKINLAIKEEFDRRGIEFAFPTQTLYVQNQANSLE